MVVLLWVRDSAAGGLRHVSRRGWRIRARMKRQSGTSPEQFPASPTGVLPDADPLPQSHRRPWPATTRGHRRKKGGFALFPERSREFFVFCVLLLVLGWLSGL